MTMDIKQSRMNGIKMAPGSPGTATLANDLHPNHHHHHSATATMTTKLPSGGGGGGRASAGKRSFDVAFLMMPDEKLGRSKSERLAYLFPGAARFYEPPAGMMFGAVGPFGRTGTRSSLSGSPDLPSSADPMPPRSAFSKVTTSIISVPDSPGPPPLSPDDRQSCPSTSPPISLSPGGGGGSQHSQASGFRYEYGPFLTPTGSPPVLLGDQLRPKSFRSPAPGGPPLPALGVLDPSVTDPAAYFHGGGPGGPVVGHFPLGGGGGGGVLPEVDGLMRNPAAAAILSTLLPSAMSTFTLSAQNVCAKCNISFRMTSDLVYHMRSHHKSEREVHDQARRKREDKLKCPVCNESFRERHHLTRHMTAHQDKAGDLLEPAAKSSSKRSPDGAAKHHHQHHQHHHHQQHHQHPPLPLGGGGAGGRLA
ncbi:zinc finger protein 488 [Anopheles darlingi]|uniref:zinc finger protein 488 n=1 Tax=Anopheles darlingi TaxID=43151 RepID=UPI0021004F37|nr:zinc finger protein 488 [Anopheles darlingi]